MGFEPTTPTLARLFPGIAPIWPGLRTVDKILYFIGLRLVAVVHVCYDLRCHGCYVVAHPFLATKPEGSA